MREAARDSRLFVLLRESAWLKMGIFVDIGAPILLIPGISCSARLFLPQIPAIWKYRPVMVADHRTGSSITEIAENILAAAPPRFSLVGFSMGGYVALDIMCRAGDRVERLALISTSARPEDASQAAGRAERIAGLSADETGSWVEQRFRQLVDPSRKDDQNLLYLYRQMALEDVGRDASVRHLTATLDRPDARPTLSRISCPAAILVGESDKITPPALSREIAEGITGSRLTIIPGCGHLSPIERPEAVTQALLQWLKISGVHPTR
jgi:pimeloyl-ACP methyl ester carboxylesterase